MKWINEDEGVFDYALKGLTAFSLIFGVWVYLDTIHPVFEKERELQALKSVNVELEQTKAQLTAETNKAKELIADLRDSVSELEKKEFDLNAAISNRESELASLEQKLAHAEREAVQNELNYYTDKLINSYLLAISSGKKTSFDVISEADNLLRTHAKPETQYDRKAYQFFKKYVDDNRSKEFEGEDQIIGFAIMLSHQYRVGQRFSW